MRTEVIDSVPDILVTMFKEFGCAKLYSTKTPANPVNATFVKISNKYEFRPFISFGIYNPAIKTKNEVQ